MSPIVGASAEGFPARCDRGRQRRYRFFVERHTPLGGPVLQGSRHLLIELPCLAFGHSRTVHLPPPWVKALRISGRTGAAKIVCRDIRNDEIFIRRSIRDDLAVECFEAFTRALHQLTAPSVPPVTVNINAPVTVGEGLHLEPERRSGTCRLSRSRRT